MATVVPSPHQPSLLLLSPRPRTMPRFLGVAPTERPRAGSLPMSGLGWLPTPLRPGPLAMTGSLAQATTSHLVEDHRVSIPLLFLSIQIHQLIHLSLPSALFHQLRLPVWLCFPALALSSLESIDCASENHPNQFKFHNTFYTTHHPAYDIKAISMMPPRFGNTELPFWYGIISA